MMDQGTKEEEATTTRTGSTTTTTTFSSSSSSSLNNLSDIAKLFQDTIAVENHQYRGTNYPNSFFGTDAVTLLQDILNDLCHKLDIANDVTGGKKKTTKEVAESVVDVVPPPHLQFSRQHAEWLGRHLAQTYNLFSHVVEKHTLLVDDYYIYHFTNTNQEQNRQDNDDDDDPAVAAAAVPPQEEEEDIKQYLIRLLSGEFQNDEDYNFDDEEDLMDEFAALDMIMESMGTLPEYSENRSTSSMGSRHHRNIIDLPLAAQYLENGVKVKSHRFRGIEYPNTFLGSDAVDVLLASGSASTRLEAEQLGQTLALEHNLFHHCPTTTKGDDDGDVTDDEVVFADNHYFFKFTEPKERQGLAINNIKAEEEKQSDNESSMETISQAFKENIVVKDRTHRLKMYPNSFVGSHAVSYLVDAGYASTRIQAVEVGRKLHKELHLFRSADGNSSGGDDGEDNDVDFQDDYYFYQFHSDEEKEKDEDSAAAASGAFKYITTADSKIQLTPIVPKPPIFQRSESEVVRVSQARLSTGVISENLNWKFKLRKFESFARRLRKTSEIEKKSRRNLGLCWARSFRDLDPRCRILEHFQEVSQLGVDSIEQGKTLNDLFSLIDIWDRRDNVFTVWRPTSNDAIKKMMKGEAVGKCLDIKGKSSKAGKLSGYVPFLQIGDNRHKRLIRTLRKGSKVRIFFRYEVDTVVKRLQGVLADMLDRVKQAKLMLQNNMANLTTHNRKEAQEVLEAWDMSDPSIQLIDDYIQSSNPCFGLEIPARLFWEAFIVRQDITRKPGSDYDTGRASIPSNQDLNNNTLLAKPPEDAPRPVLLQVSEDPMNPQELLMAYEEDGNVLPAASDFDAFLVGTRGVDFDAKAHALPKEQLNMLEWLVTQIGKILDSPPRPGSWTKRWWQNLEGEMRQGTFKSPPMPRLGFGDPRSYSIMENVVKRLSYGAVRHGAECFNFKVPQEMDDEYLVIWGKLKYMWITFKEPKGSRSLSWKKMNEGDKLLNRSWQKLTEGELQKFLSDRIDDGYTFPLNPKWVLCDNGWKRLYDKLLASERDDVRNSMNIWFPPAIRQKIEEVYAKHPSGFEGCPLRSQEEVQKHFVSLLKEKGVVHRKTTTTFARRGVKGENVWTAIYGVLETKNTVEDDQSWELCGQAGERYVLSNEEFQECYDESSAQILEKESESLPHLSRRLQSQGFREYKPNPKRQVLARTVDSDDMKWFRFGLPPKPYEDGNAAYFCGSSREYMRVEEGDILVMQYSEGNNEVYRIENSVFHLSYEPLDPTKPLPTKNFNPEGSSKTFIGIEETGSIRLSAGRVAGRQGRSQKEVQARFLPILKEKNNLYHKFVTTYIKKGIRGKQIFTTIDGILETENVVRDDTSWEVLGKANESYIITNEHFEAKYEEYSAESVPPALSDQGYRAYKPKGKVLGHEVDKNDLFWFHFENPPHENAHVSHFMAPWGELTRVEEGDMLVTEYPSGKDEVYRVESFVFRDSYKLMET